MGERKSHAPSDVLALDKTKPKACALTKYQRVKDFEAINLLVDCVYHLLLGRRHETEATTTPRVPYARKRASGEGGTNEMSTKGFSI